MTASSASDVRTSAAPVPATPASLGRYPLLDSIRGLAVLVVMAFHVASITGSLAKPTLGEALSILGALSIVLFFVMSGFLLYRPFVAAHAAGKPFPHVGRFARRRMFRLLPAYWVALTLLAIFPGIVGVFTEDWWRYYFFGQIYSDETYGHGIPVAWTLCVELTFYATIPVVALLTRRVRSVMRTDNWLRAELVVLALMALGGFAVQYAGKRQDVTYLISESLLGQSAWFAIGMALAGITVAVQRGELHSRLVRAVSDHAGLCWAAALVPFAILTAVQPAGGLLAIVASLNTPQPPAKALTNLALMASMAVLFVAPALFGDSSKGFVRRALGFTPIAWLGLVSYALYLYHLTVAEFLMLPADDHFSQPGLGLLDDVHFAAAPIMFLLTLAVSGALATASWYLVELPFLRRK
ncbi:MAG: hypothetical protein QOI45_2256 [Thermoleophilaceae bacterium]|nr:hypothetical protein [Thermoleophilaceae bacterium]